MAACAGVGQPGASPGRLIWINAAAYRRMQSWLVETPNNQAHRTEIIHGEYTSRSEEDRARAANAPDAWRSFRTEMDRLFDRFAGGWGMPSLRRMFDAEPAFQYESSFAMPSPAVDITEDDGAYKVTAELPGMSEKEIEVVVSGDTLSIKGEKRLEKEQKEKNFYLSERSYGSFQRSFYVPEGVDRDKIAADFSKGVLTVTMPKTAKAMEQTKKIEVKSAT